MWLTQHKAIRRVSTTHQLKKVFPSLLDFVTNYSKNPLTMYGKIDAFHRTYQIEAHLFNVYLIFTCY